MALTPSVKIALGWTVLISTGLYGFVMARDSVVQNRKVLMATRQRIKDQAQREGAEKFRQRELQRNPESSS